MALMFLIALAWDWTSMVAAILLAAMVVSALAFRFAISLKSEASSTFEEYFPLARDTWALAFRFLDCAVAWASMAYLSLSQRAANLASWLLKSETGVWADRRAVALPPFREFW